MSTASLNANAATPPALATLAWIAFEPGLRIDVTSTSTGSCQASLEPTTLPLIETDTELSPDALILAVFAGPSSWNREIIAYLRLSFGPQIQVGTGPLAKLAIAAPPWTSPPASPRTLDGATSGFCETLVPSSAAKADIGNEQRARAHERNAGLGTRRGISISRIAKQYQVGRGLGRVFNIRSISPTGP